jgi:Na+-transporting methylmalonyl-CoA/oxaloacetate decarboxylase beta subunit
MGEDKVMNKVIAVWTFAIISMGMIALFCGTAWGCLLAVKTLLTFLKVI